MARFPRALIACVAFVTLAVFAAACSSAVVTADSTETDSTQPVETTPPTTATPEPTVPETTAPPPTTVAPTTAPPTTVAINPDGAESVATLLDAGAEPRQELRFDYADGDTFAFDTEVSQAISQTINGVAGPDGAPVLTTLGQTGTVTVMGDAFVLESTTDSAIGVVEGDAALTAQVQAALDAVLGLVERRVVDPSGIVFEFELLNTDGMDPAILGPAATAGENGVALAFPLEAVGVGARWETVATLEVSGLSVEQVTAYEVLSIDGPIVELSVTSSQFVAPGSAMDIPGAEATVEAWSAEGRGTMTVDLTSPAALSEIAGEIDQTLLIVADGEEVEIIQKIINGTKTTPR